MRILPLAVACLGTLTVACEDNQPSEPTRPIVVRSEVQNQLHKLDPLNQKIAMRRAIFDAGATCQRVEEAGYVQEYGNLSMWTATCSDGFRWAIFVAPDGTAQIRRCEHVEELNLPRCVIAEKSEDAGSGDRGNSAG